MTLRDLLNEMFGTAELNAGLDVPNHEGNGADLPLHVPDEFRGDKNKKKKSKKKKEKK